MFFFFCLFVFYQNNTNTGMIITVLCDQHVVAKILIKDYAFSTFSKIRYSNELPLVNN